MEWHQIALFSTDPGGFKAGPVSFFSNVSEQQQERGEKKNPVPGTRWVFSEWFP